MKKKLAAVVFAVATVAALISSSPSMAAEVAGVFSKGRTHFVVTGGTGYAFDETYFVLGLGVSYYLVDGLNVGLYLESWTGSNPSLYKITPSVQYVFYQSSAVKPFIGGFYRRTKIEDLPDLDSVGARAGLYWRAGNNAYFGVGAVYESYLDCNETTYRSCDDTYPELSFTIAF